MNGGGEAAWLAAVRRGLGEASTGPGVALGIGDDAAVLVPPQGQRLVATVDMLVEGQHFLRRGPAAARPQDIGWRALAVNLSDVAAMGGRPRWALASIAVPEDMTEPELEALAGGMAALAGMYGVAVVGGNLARAAGGLAVDVTLLGTVEDAVRRAGARPGDRICVTGRLGAAAAGLALLEAGGNAPAVPAAAQALVLAAQRRPAPRVREGIALGAAAARGGVHAMCDISDGLTVDLDRLCGGSLGAVLWRSALPVPPEVEAVAAALSGDALGWALHGGEDYELLCAVPPDAVEDVVEAAGRAGGAALHVIGEFVASPAGVRLAPEPGAAAVPVPVAGWDPFR